MADDSRALPVRPVAVVDVGSNSIRLVVYRNRSRAPIPIFNERVICGIGNDLARTGRLDKDGVAQAMRNLPRFAALTRSMGAEEVAILATAATREATDGNDFLNRIEAMFDTKVRQLEGSEEARLAALGVICGLPAADGVAADLGGGSLELAEIAKGEVGRHGSLPLGPLRLRAAYGADRAAMLRAVDEALSGFDVRKALRGRTLYIVGGAWRALARLHMYQVEHPLRVIHNYHVPATAMAEFCEVVSALSPSSLARIEVVPRQRAATLPLAATVLGRLITMAGPSDVAFSALGIREGWLYESLPPDRQAADPLLVACSDFAHRESRFPEHADMLAGWLAPLFPKEPPALKRLREAACLLADIGWYEHPDYRAEQVYFRILRLPLLALDHREKAKIAFAVYRRYGGPMRDHALRLVDATLDDEDIAWARRLGAALRLAETITAGNTDLLEGTSLKMGKSRITLKLGRKHAELGGDNVESRFNQLAKAFGRSTKLDVKSD